MGEGSNRRRSVGQWVAVLLIGMLAGSVMLTPAGAHLNSPLTFSHLKKHFYTKKAANSAFINVGEQATSAASAVNADKLDNLDSAAFQKACSPGVVKAYAYIDVDTLSTTAFTTAGVLDAFNCTGGGVTAKKVAAGLFQVKIPGVTGAPGERIVTANPSEALFFFGCSTTTDVHVAYHDANTDAGVQVLEFSVDDVEDSTGATDPANDANGTVDADIDFAFAVYN